MSAENPDQILDGILGTSVSTEQGFKSTNDVQSYLRRSDRSRENIPINFSVDPSVTILERKCTFIHSFISCVPAVGLVLNLGIYNKQSHDFYP